MLPELMPGPATVTIRPNCNDVANQVNVEDPAAVRDAVVAILSSRYPIFRFERVARSFDYIAYLYAGRLPGYRACDTPYHDLRHVLEITLALARIVDGHDRACPARDRLGATRAALGVLVALFHDTGYLLETNDTLHRNGAELTTVHVTRGAALMSGYLADIGLGEYAPMAAQLIQFTGYEVPLAHTQIQISQPLDRKLGYMIGSADLIGQMSDRLYLEKCRDFLYQEFVVGGLTKRTAADGSEEVVYGSGTDLLAQTPRFYETMVTPRLENYFAGVHHCVAAHFDGVNHYLTQIKQHMQYLGQLITQGELQQLRRRPVSLSAAF
jgi:hypothetical protein